MKICFDESNPQIEIPKLKTPVIYLDTCILIELSRYEKRCCTNEHREEIGNLYKVLIDLMQSNRILCSLGNQLVEMGTTKKRIDSIEFLNRFTNSEMYLPNQIYDKQLDVGYHSFLKNDTHISFQTIDVFKNIVSPNEQYKIYILSEKGREIAQREKENKQKIAEALNNFKQSTFLSKDFETQYEKELQADYQALEHIREKCRYRPDIFMEHLDFLMPIFKRAGINKPGEFVLEKKSENYNRYLDFLTSPYHCKLPYIHIRAVLFTHILQRANNIIPSDKLDILWASAYLPFVDFAVTDARFCRLLNDSGLAGAYHTKVYNFSTLQSLIEELSK